MEKLLNGVRKREVLVNIVGIVLARAMIFSVNPIAMGYFAAVYVEKRTRVAIFLCTLMGMATVMPIVDVVKYGLVMLVVVVITKLAEHNKGRIRIPVMGCVAGAVTIGLNMTKGLLYTNYQYYFIMAVLEGVLIWVISILFHKGIHYFLYSKKGQPMDNEELISIGILLAVFSYAMPSFSTEGFSLVPMMAYLFILFMGFKYGAGAGSIAGAACGVVFSLGNGSLNLIGIMCLLGICSGMFREVGKLGTAIGFLVCCLLLGYLYEDIIVQVFQVRALVSAAAIFVLIPKQYLYPVDLAMKEIGENVYAKHNLQMITKTKLRDFSDSFQKLSKAFYHMADTKQSLNRKDVDNVFDELSERLCRHCVKCNYCWKHNYYNTYQAAYSIIGAVDRDGTILEEEIPFDFTKSCINYKTFIEETQRSLEMAKVNLGWYNRMAESREVIASQLGEVANIIKEFATDIYETKVTTNLAEEQVFRKLTAHDIDVKKLAILEKRNKRQEVYLTVKTKKGRCITAKEAASYIGEVLGKRIKPSDNTKHIIPKEYESLVFVEDVNFKTLTGVARMVKPGEKVSGDNFSFLELNSGEMIMTLSDGMGTGQQAHTESESVVELLEQFVEAGFKETSAIKLINSVLVLKSDKQTFSTVDMSVINLFTGICEFIKVGAAATFIKRHRWVETICSTSMPVGIFTQVDFDGISKKLYDGDMVIMMTDGVLDCFSGDNKEKHIEDLLVGIESRNPQEVANLILKKAVEESQHPVFDDMTVLVSGIWEKVG